MQTDMNSLNGTIQSIVVSLLAYDLVCLENCTQLKAKHSLLLKLALNYHRTAKNRQQKAFSNSQSTYHGGLQHTIE